LRFTDSAKPVERLRPLTVVEVLIKLVQDLIAPSEKFVPRQGNAEYSLGLRFDRGLLTAVWCGALLSLARRSRAGC